MDFGSGGQAVTGETDVLLQDVKVLATGQIANKREDHPTVVQTVTVEVSTEQAQKLILAERVGTLSLVLRQVGEAIPEAIRRITVTDLGELNRPRRPRPHPHLRAWPKCGSTAATRNRRSIVMSIAKGIAKRDDARL